ncbi:uncharacterized protein LOC127870133 [Dreissena polymorpha]|uniref:uncharacterized protein LOC127870133 n=1 Tax=Dreissena polymorpha TaxID=45954 RepID=UPI002263C702|nr:uncharacterized protein LOC127870133 [Dreissena polymorpha]
MEPRLSPVKPGVAESLPGSDAGIATLSAGVVTMALIDEVFRNRASGQLERALNLLIVARNQPSTYIASNGEERHSLTVAASDGVQVIKVTIYYQSKFMKFQTGTPLSVRHSIRKTQDGEQTLRITKPTKVFITQALVEPGRHVQQGQILINPPEADVLPIQQAIRSLLKQRVSVCGRIVQEEGVRTVDAKGSAVNVKKIEIRDGRESAEVSLWREQSQKDFHTGQYVRNKDGKHPCKRTSRSNMEPADEPDYTRRVTFAGVSVEGEIAQLLLSDDEVVTASSKLLLEALPEGMDSDLEHLTVNGTIDLNIEIKGTEVLTIQDIQ